MRCAQNWLQRLKIKQMNEKATVVTKTHYTSLRNFSSNFPLHKHLISFNMVSTLLDMRRFRLGNANLLAD